MPIQASNEVMSVISAAVAPVVLISAVSILFSGLTTKHSHLSDQMRQLTTEYRDDNTDEDRKKIIKRQIWLFDRRSKALWFANGCLSLSILSFVLTILLVLYYQQPDRMGSMHLGFAVIMALVFGLAFIVLALIGETYEIALGRYSLALETADIDLAPEPRR